VGSVLSLDAIGKQDTYLLGNSSFFDYNVKRHSNFQVYQTTTFVPPFPGVPNWPFNGSSVYVTLYPKQMGDLLTKMYLQCTLPVLPDTLGMFPDSRYCDNVGRAIINSVKFSVDQYEVETLYDDWMHMYDDMYLTIEEKTASQALTAGVGDRTKGPLDLYIPLNFFFSAKASSYFPLCAAKNQKITLQIVFNSVNFFSNCRVTNPNPTYNLSLPSFNIVCEQIILSDLERVKFQESLRLLVPVSQRQPEVQANAGDTQIKVNLVMNMPVETVHWTLRQQLFEQADIVGVTNYFLNRYNYSASDSTDIVVQSRNPIMSDMTIFINNQPDLGFFASQGNIDPTRAIYYRYAQPLKCKLSSPQINAYTYTFSLDAMNNQLAGAINFSQIPAQTTYLNINFLSNVVTPTSVYTCQVFYMALRELKFSNGFMSF